MRKLKLSGGERTFSGLKELREAAGEFQATVKDLGGKFDARKQQGDAGQEVALWEGDEEQRFAAAVADRKLIEAAIEEEQRANDVAAEVALANRQHGGDGTRHAADDTGVERRITVPARCRPIGKLKAFRSLEEAYACGQYIRGVLVGEPNAARWCCDYLPEESRAMGGSALAKGGALVPHAMATAVIDLVEQYGIALADCEVVRMTTDTLDVPRVTGGVTLYAINENTEITASKPAFDSVGLTARKYGALVKYSSELDEDSVIDIAELLVRKVAWAWAKKLDECLFLGDGTSTYHGIKGIKNALADGSEVTAITGNTAFSTLDLADFEGMIGKLASWAEARARWYISKAGWAASMARLADAAGGNTIEHLAAGPQRTFLGYPVRFAQVMNSTLGAQTSTEGLAYLGDLMGGVMVGLRRDLRMMVSRERYMEYDQIGFVATVRFDVNVHDVGGSSTPGGIIGLETPGS